MRLLINTSSAAKGGSVQVATSFLKECRAYPEHSFGVIVGPGLVDAVRDEEFPENFVFYYVAKRPAQRLWCAVRGDIYTEIEQAFMPDCVFTTSGPAYWRSSCPHLVGYNLPHYVYGDSPYFKKLPLFERLRWWSRGIVIRYFYRRDADALVVQTDDVNQRSRRFLGVDDVVTVSNTCGAQYFEVAPKVDLLSESFDGEFRLLCLSAYYEHKNLNIINLIIDELSKRGIDFVRFVLTIGPDELEANFTSDAQKWIYNVGRVSHAEAPRLYEEVDCMFLPSLLECFSASYAEAMVKEVPILTSDLGFSKTVCGEAALYFDPLDPVEIANKIIALITREELRQELRAIGRKRIKQFCSASERAHAYISKCKDLVDQTKRP